jgi:hypothetical protein
VKDLNLTEKIECLKAGNNFEQVYSDLDKLNNFQYTRSRDNCVS